MTITQYRILERAKRQARAIPERKNKRQAIRTLLAHLKAFLGQ